VERIKERRRRTVCTVKGTAAAVEGRRRAAEGGSFLGEAALLSFSFLPSFLLLLFSSTRWNFVCYFYRQPLAAVVEEEAETNPIPMRATWHLLHRPMDVRRNVRWRSRLPPAALEVNYVAVSYLVLFF
jgi:hypothetical protein